MATVVAGVLSYYGEDWLAGLGILVLWAIWALLYRRGTTPVLAVALSFQWVQVTCGLYYFAITGRQLEAMLSSDYRTMIFIGLGCLTALAGGISAGERFAPESWRRNPERERAGLPWRVLFTAYLVTLAVNGVVREVAWYVPTLTQGLLATGYIRLAALFLMLRRVVSPVFRAKWFLGLISFEVLLGFTGFFAGFREPLVLGVLAMVEVFDRRSTTHWLRLGSFAATMLFVGLLWMGIRNTYRAEIQNTDLLSSRAARLERVGSLSNTWLDSTSEEILDDLDALVDRMWAIYYPALAVARVPESLPHEDGEILFGALRHLVTPRFLFPDKPVLPSDSDMVRKYTGIMVAGADQNTSIAFGYAAEAYIDFGLPWMFLPSLFFGVAMGLLYRFLYYVIHHRDLAVGLVTVVFWLSLYPWERSWVMTFGLSLTLAVYLGGVVMVIDRWLESSRILSPRPAAGRNRGLPLRQR